MGGRGWGLSGQEEAVQERTPLWSCAGEVPAPRAPAGRTWSGVGVRVLWEGKAQWGKRKRKERKKEGKGKKRAFKALL